ncbi:ribonuclease Z [Candidatus Palauibacter sp.]|uniref:ribonuclease Z n=1 Tax=Candidatus Palauibacter sp. TaxID=3101350 RepID=UPI003B01EB11
MLRLTFLGTASSRPTVSRNVPALALKRAGRRFLLDCGEGTQRQMMRYGVGFSVGDILITHLHSDHYLGLAGLLRTMSLQGREEPLRIWAPRGAGGALRTLRDLGGDRLAFEAPVRELRAGQAVEGDGYRLEAFATDHTRASLGYALLEDPRPGRFDVGAARALGVPEGPLFGRLHGGESVELEDGRRVDPTDLVGPPRPGRKLVYTGDTRPSPQTVEIAGGADLLVHEATFSAEEARRARETGHSTAGGAARIAAEAGVKRLVLTHISARYAERPARLLEEARAIFPRTELARDGWSVEVPFDDADSGGATP